MKNKPWKQLTDDEKRVKFALLNDWVCKDGRAMGRKFRHLFASGYQYWSPNGENSWQNDPPAITLDEVHKAEMKLTPAARKMIAMYLKYDCFADADKRAEAYYNFFENNS